MKSLGGRINEERAMRGMTIKFLSEKTGIPYSMLQPCLCGRREFRADEYFKVCYCLGIDPIATYNSVS